MANVVQPPDSNRIKQLIQYRYPNVAVFEIYLTKMNALLQAYAELLITPNR